MADCTFSMCAKRDKVSDSVRYPALQHHTKKIKGVGPEGITLHIHHVQWEGAFKHAYFMPTASVSEVNRVRFYCANRPSPAVISLTRECSPSTSLSMEHASEQKHRERALFCSCTLIVLSPALCKRQ